MRYVPIVILVVVGVLIATRGCDSGNDPLEIFVGPLDHGETTLPFQADLDRRTVSLRYVLKVRSLTDKAVTLKLALAEGATKGVSARLTNNRIILPGGTETFSVMLGLPNIVGPFQADFVFTSDDLPDWSLRYELRGVKAEVPDTGRYIAAEPTGIDLGTVRPGEKKKFAFKLRATGTEAVTLSDVRFGKESGIDIPDLGGDERIEPGQMLLVQGTIVCRAKPGEVFTERIEIYSDATNAPVRTIGLRGRLLRDHELFPPSLPLRRVYPHMAQDYSVEVRAAKGEFTVARVASLEPFFELVGELSKTPAATQQLTFRLRGDAPTSPHPVTGAIRIYVDPSGSMLEWPYRVTVLPSVYAQPAQVDFQTVSAARLVKPMEREIQLVALPGLEFEVTSVQAEGGLFLLRKERRAGLPWKIIVTLPAGSKRGIYRDRILIETTAQQAPRMYVKVSAVVK
ncbi:MAG: hypothetical protein ACYTHK_07675 [Planctomycetota bacterium]